MYVPKVLVILKGELTIIVELKELAKEECYSILDEFHGILIVARFKYFDFRILFLNHGGAEHTAGLITSDLEHTIKLCNFAASRALQLQLCNSSFFQTLLSFSFQDSGRNRLIFVVMDSLCCVPVFLGVDAKALGNKVHTDAVDMLDQSLNRWEQLLSDVPVNVNLDLAL
jgi:hypothetical protein